MQTRQLGKLQVSAIGLGCMSMSQSYGVADRAESGVRGDRYAKSHMISLDPDETDA